MMMMMVVAFENYFVLRNPGVCAPVSLERLRTKDCKTVAGDEPRERARECCRSAAARFKSDFDAGRYGALQCVVSSSASPSFL